MELHLGLWPSSKVMDLPGPALIGAGKLSMLLSTRAFWSHPQIHRRQERSRMGLLRYGTAAVLLHRMWWPRFTFWTRPTYWLKPTDDPVVRKKPMRMNAVVNFHFKSAEAGVDPAG